MRAIEVLAGIFAGVAIVNIVFFSRQSPAVIGSVFKGSTDLFGTLTTNRG